MLKRISGPWAFAAAAAVLLVNAWRLSAGAGKAATDEKAQAKKPAVAGKPAPLTPAAILERLAAPMEVRKGEFDSIPLGEALDFLEAGRDWPQAVVNEAAFKEENPDVQEVRNFPVKLPALHGVARAKVLRMLLDQIPTLNATYLVRPGYVEITTNAAAAPAKQLVRGSFVRLPLEAALQEMAEQTGISIVVDARVGEKARLPVTATFRGDTGLLNAVRLLADMAELKVVVADNVLYVTPRTNQAAFPPTGGLEKKEAAG